MDEYALLNESTRIEIHKPLRLETIEKVKGHHHQVILNSNIDPKFVLVNKLDICGFDQLNK